MLLTVLSSATCQVNCLELSTPDPLKHCRTHCRLPRSSSPPCPIWRLPRILTHLWHHGDTFHRVYPRLTPASRAAVVAMSPSEISRRHRSSLKRQPARDTHWQVRGERGTRTGREAAIAKRGVVTTLWLMVALRFTSGVSVQEIRICLSQFVCPPSVAHSGRVQPGPGEDHVREAAEPAQGERLSLRPAMM